MFNAVKCWVSMNLHMRRDGGFPPSPGESKTLRIEESLIHSQLTGRLLMQQRRDG